MSWVTLLSLVVGALAAPASPAVDYEAMAKQFAPQYLLHPSEAYFPSSVEYMLPHYSSILDSSGKVLAQLPSGGLSGVNLAAAAPNSGSGAWLTVPDTGAAYLKGVNPSNSGVPVYTFIVPKDNGIVDFFYWTFYPYNKGKSIIILGEVGDHIGDWERMSVRTQNGAPISADYNAHSGGSQAAGTIQWSDVPKVSGQDRPKGYVAEGSHGVWPSAGSHAYVNIVIYKLTDDCADGGAVWDAQNNVVPIMYQANAGYTGSLSWLNFQGNWGNKGQTDCWWYAIDNECPMSDGPNGPYRPSDLTAAKVAAVNIGPVPQAVASKFRPMDGPPAQTLAPLSTSGNSLFKFHLASTSLSFISSKNVSFVALEQRCADANKVTSMFQFAPVGAATQSEYTITSPACATSTHVDSYQIGLCTAASQTACAWSFEGYRDLKTYTPGVSGVTNGTAVHLDSDPDVWKFKSF